MTNAPLASAASILSAMAVIGLIDQFVQVIAESSSLWTFHLLRSTMMVGLVALWLLVAGRRLSVVSWRGVAGRAAFLSLAMIVYFGALGFLPVAQAAAGLFTAPLWVMIFSVGLFGLRIGPVRALAALAGFAGVLLVLSPDPSDLSAGSFVPLVAGAFYAVAAIATREWCGAESTLTLATSSFVALGLWGLFGVVTAWLVGPGDGFLTRGWVTPDAEVWFWIAIQAIGSLGAVILLTRGYQLAEASLASIFEYSVLGFSALFGWLVWNQVTGPLGLIGLALIAGAGAVVALRGRPA
ncbi:DMT family transporter [Jannaschia aquimarina]|uniref:EamA-like transporter family protein n=1 Tax=Jannaschia aquimarina TaxID=935700 RepID=A0A0D1DDT5_9RHOB|nr:DMT family transporter [Jannaschia aquimarina]KIT18138.1 EamA-like transporter family protein [Jannaschia aquimarina]SNT30278.1 hypothetical protein SAMN05421775_110129 [Jannaschia aquimarina]